MTRRHYILIAVVFIGLIAMFYNQERSMAKFQPKPPPCPEGVYCT